MKAKAGILIIVAILSWHLCASAADSATSKVLALEKQWNEAYRLSDIAKMNDLLSDDYIITIEDGSTFSKTGYIAHNGNTTIHVDLSEMSDLAVRIHGDTAVVTGAYHERGTEQGKPYEYHDRLTDVWMNIQGRWRLIASHYSLRTK